MTRINPILPIYRNKPAKSKKPTLQQRLMWEKIRAMGCLICVSPAEIHHIETGMGGRKNHDRVIPLCPMHHRGEEGIHTLGRKVWQQKYKTEQELYEIVQHSIDIQV